MLFVSLVPHAQIKYDSGKKSAFCNAQKEAGGEQSGKALSKTHEGANNPPYDGDSGKPESGRRPFEDDVAGDLEQGVADEPDGQCREVLVSGLFQVVRDALIACTRGESLLMFVSSARPSMRAFPTTDR